MPHPIADYFTRILAFPQAALSDDGRRLAYICNVSGTPQVWVGRVPAGDGLLSYPVPVTHGRDEQPHVMGPALQWIGSDRLVCLLDRHGDEQTFLKILNLAGGPPLAVPAEEGARDFLGFVAADRRTIFFVSSRGNPRSRGLYSFDLRTKAVRKLFHHAEESAGWFGDQSWKGHRLFYRASATYANTLHAVHPRSGAAVDLFTEPGTLITPIGAAPKGGLLVVTNFGRQFQSLARLDPSSRRLEFLERDRWDAEEAKLSADGRHLLVSRNVAGKSELELYAYPSLKRRPIPALPKGVSEGLTIARDSRSAVFASMSAARPRDFYHLDLRRARARPLTDNWTSPIPRKELVEPKLVRYASEGREIYSWLYLPKKARRDGTVPVIVWPHGGPQAQERAQFRPIFQYFLGRGFALWAPNPTGSTGFGRDFVNAICGHWGVADLPDMKNGLAWLKASGWINPGRLFIMGGSYGGYMTLRSITRIPRTFRAAVDIFGVSNLFTFVQSVPPDWRPFMTQLVGNPVADAEKLREASPLFSLDRIDCPLMVVQGARDPRVVQAESDQAVAELKRLGKTVEYLVFEDEGHGFLKPENELKAYTAIAEFLERNR